MTLGALGVTLSALGWLWMPQDSSSSWREGCSRLCSEAAACHCLGQAAACRCQAGTGSCPRILGGCKALYQVSALPLHSLGLVLPPYSTYYIQANLSDQILQVKCK